MKNNTTYRIFEHFQDVDISEQDIMDYDPVVLDKLLVDHTMSAKARSEASDPEKVINIFRATSDYENSVLDEHGNFIEEGYRYDGKHYLWNAKMCFGKTLSGLEVAKRCGYRSTLIITHRPVVDKGWHDDFEKIFRTPEAPADIFAQLG